MSLRPLKIWHLLVGVAAVGLALGLSTLFDNAQRIIWDGGYELSVDLRDNSGRPVKAVSAVACWNVVEADYHREHPHGVETQFKSVSWTLGRPFDVYVQSSGHATRSGRELSRVQAKYLVLLVEYADGTHSTVMADIPDGRKSRSLTVAVP